MPLSDAQISALLQDNQVLDEAVIKAAQIKSAEEKISLYEALLEMDVISDENLGKIIADSLKIPFITLSKTAIDDNILHIIPESVARKQQAIAYELSDTGLKIGTSKPDNTLFFEFLSQKIGQKVIPYFATDRDVEDNLRLYKKELQKTFEDLITTKKMNANDSPIPLLVDKLLEYAYENKASDIHIEPTKEQAIIRFRIDGVLHDVLKLPKNLHAQIVSKIKVIARLRTDEHINPQDGKIQKKVDTEDLAIRVSIVPITHGEKIVMRLLASHFRQFGLADLGMSEDNLRKVRNAFTKSYGIVLSTGPTGSGKTTTMYAVVKILNSREKNIATIEDPVEYEIEGLNQIQVNQKTNLTFASGLRSILRQDPDIIYVGEIRDEETADIAINAAMTGHLVLSTLHTNDAATTLPRLINMGIEPFLVASTVNAIIGQRLIRKICEKCKVSFTVTSKELEVNLDKTAVKKHFGTSKEIRLYHGKGCKVCHNTGYMGRIGIFEVLEVSPTIQNLLTQKVDADVIKSHAIKEGMVTMLEDGISKAQQGITTIEEVLRLVRK